MDGSAAISFLLNLALKLLRPVVKILWYTGLIFPALVKAGYSSAPVVYWIIAWLLCLVMAAYRLWKIYNTHFAHIKAERQTTNPNANNSLISPAPHGVVFGKQDYNYIIKPEHTDGHILVVGGVGSGKSSCVAIPTLRVWNQSVFAIDIKGELYEKTRSYRPNIKVFNPLDNHSYGYDPYFLLKHSSNKAQEARAIAQAIIPLPPDVKDPFWIQSAQNILTGAVLHFFNLDYNFIEILQTVQNSSAEGLIKVLADSDIQEVRYYTNSFVGMDTKTLSGVISELSNHIIALVTDKNLVDCFTRKRNISPRDLELGYDVYINIPQHLLRQWKDLLTLMVNQFLTFFEQRNESTAKPILFLLDEFPRIGKLDTIVDGLATLRSKKITICLIIQSLSQLDAIYGSHNRKIIADTCAYKAILGATDAETQEYFSKLVGTYDKIQTSKGTQSDPFTGIRKSNSTNKSPQEKRIIKPEEFATLTHIVLLTPYGFCRVRKWGYYNAEDRR